MTSPSADGGATIVDLSARPYDARPAVNAVLARLREALNADQRAIVLLGEEHTTISHVRFAEELRFAIAQDLALSAHFGQPLIAREQDYNLFQGLAPRLFPELKDRFDAAAYHRYRQEDPAIFHRLNMLTFAAWSWSYSPVTNLENMITWIEAGQDVCVIDVARRSELGKSKHYLDLCDPLTHAWIRKLEPEMQEQITANGNKISLTELLGMNLRNRWMAHEISMMDSRCIVLQTGVAHVGGRRRDLLPYETSLHMLLRGAPNTKLISVWPEKNDGYFKNRVSEAGQLSMHNPDTIILKGGCGSRHDQSDSFTDEDDAFEHEIYVLQKIHDTIQNGPSPRIKTKRAYDHLREHYQQTLLEEAVALGVLKPAAHARAPSFVQNEASAGYSPG